MLEFRIGDRVTFQSERGGLLEGILTRYNKKTVTVITDQGQQWNVSPSFLQRVSLIDPEN
jgi:putative flippase GtrA